MERETHRRRRIKGFGDGRIWEDMGGYGDMGGQGGIDEDMGGKVNVGWIGKVMGRYGGIRSRRSDTADAATRPI